MNHASENAASRPTGGEPCILVLLQILGGTFECATGKGVPYDFCEVSEV